MAKITATSNYQFSRDPDIWSNLQYAIATTSGFQRWQLESNIQLKELRLEQQVQRYLRETLETLAY
ncbi:hypothetical protein ACN23B_19250 [Anabaena sp. FACHB-709]|jgi:hypothetical protein|uniref:Uncharacterized protein n=2 Tax=Nostocaceae TaxID=1162 RepID=A0A1Z4KKF9_ANAVA|nr:MULTISPECIES: hypothetical protein [Nostocaceae]BAY69461.1 hypothetical protein NIES23_22550 [Trichormus variabilis NIES-23]HBW30112.1 hypothetical protein [Nostoc sp. UBA8866]MBD2171073.1 hypothetical protein [Anabaena cylindrica FACHB-318]MBD2262853.1 hypothetical protein [Anabaena sp. FACHB-709]MBD2272349.1 hypothetical protein [Nostoc sp. PCC 7120 = FACHB-418]